MSQDQQATSTSTTNSALENADGGTTTAVKTRPRTAPPKVDRLPPWRVLLHNDDVNELGYVVETIIQLVRLNPRQAILQTIEAHTKGIALLMTTHREHAELLCEQFASKRLTVTVEPDR
jgi:ATP-dependent Clp protease adaptor protein ClpS